MCLLLFVCNVFVCYCPFVGLIVRCFFVGARWVLPVVSLCVVCCLLLVVVVRCWFGVCCPGVCCLLLSLVTVSC